MKTLDVHWNPLTAFHESSESIPPDFWVEPLCSHPWAGEARDDEWNPKIDVVEGACEYLVQAALPGARMEEIKVGVRDGELAISGERRFNLAGPARICRRLESDFGLFARSFTLPADASGRISGIEFQDGVLSVRLVKKDITPPIPFEASEPREAINFAD